MTLPKGTEGLPLDDKEFLEDVIRDDSKSARTARLLKLIEVLGSWIEQEQKRAREAFTEATKQTAYWKELQEQTDKGRAELARVLGEEKQAKEAARTELAERMREVLDLRAAVARMQPPSDPNRPASQPQLSIDEIRFLQRATTGEDGDARHLALLVERFRHGYVMQRERAETAEQRVRELDVVRAKAAEQIDTLAGEVSAVREVASALGWDEKIGTLPAFVRDLGKQGVIRVNITPESMSTVFNQALMQQLDEAQAAKRELAQQLEDARAAATTFEARAKRAEQDIEEVARARDRITGFSGSYNGTAIAAFVREQNDRIEELENGRALLGSKVATLEGDRAKLAEVVAAAEACGWNGVENPKSLTAFVRLQSEQLKEWGAKCGAEHALRLDAEQKLAAASSERNKALARLERIIARADTLEGTIAKIRGAAREAGILGERDVAGFITRQAERIEELERDKTSLVIKLEAERQVKSRIEELEGVEREQMQTIATLQSELEDARADYRALKEDYDRTYVEASSLRDKLRRCKAGMPNTERALVEMLASIEALRAQVDGLRAGIAPEEKPQVSTPDAVTNTRTTAYRILVVARRVHGPKAPRLVNEWVERGESRDAWETSSLDAAKRKVERLREQWTNTAYQIVERLEPVAKGADAWMRVEYVADTVPSVLDSIAEPAMYRIAVQQGPVLPEDLFWFRKDDRRESIAAFDTVTEARARVIELNETRQRDGGPQYHVMKRCIG